jgi:hypothetical protein
LAVVTVPDEHVDAFRAALARNPAGFGFDALPDGSFAVLVGDPTMAGHHYPHAIDTRRAAVRLVESSGLRPGTPPRSTREAGVARARASIGLMPGKAV